MPRARLIGYCEQLTIEPIDRPGTHVDALAEEPYAGISRNTAVVLLAQVDDGRRNARQPSQGGAKLATTLSLTFLTRDVKAKGWEPADGDRLVLRAGTRGQNPRKLNLYLTRIKYSGSTSCGHELVTMDAVGRDPRQSNEGLGIL